MGQDASDRERRAFRYWMRTGRMAPDGEVVAEWKFNPWHDPDDGRFTFRNAGRYFETGAASGSYRGGGGSFGGGGTSDSWSAPQPPHAPAQRDDKPKAPPARTALAVVAALATSRHRRSYRKVHHSNGYRYETDGLDRTRGGEGDLHLGPWSPRSRRAQRQAGGPDRRVGDDGGHYIAHRFNGPADSFNHFAQNAHFNRGAYRALEDSWARALREGKSVHLRITPDYVGASRRPSSITVEWTVNGAPYKRTFLN